MFYLRYLPIKTVKFQMTSLHNFRMMSFFNNPILVKPEVADNVNVEYDLQTKSSNNIL